MKVWLDGILVDKADAAVNVYDHGLLYGDGVFEGIRVYNGTIFECDAHVDRLFDGARAIRLEIPLTKGQIVQAMGETLEANEIVNGYIRLVVTRGAGMLGLSPFKCSRPQVFVIADSIQLYPKELYENGLSVIVASTVRNHTNALNPRIKSLNYLNNILAKIEAIDAGVEEAIMLNSLGLVAEATGDNVFIVRDGVLMTPPLSAGTLAGITRAVVMRLAREAGIELRQIDISRYDLYTADECFLTGTAAEVIPVTTIDGRTVGDGKPGAISGQMEQAFRDYIQRTT